MSIIESNENRAIARMVSRECSTGYQRAVEANIPVTYLSGSDVVCEHNGKRQVIAHIGSLSRSEIDKTLCLPKS